MVYYCCCCFYGISLSLWLFVLFLSLLLLYHNFSPAFFPLTFFLPPSLLLSALVIAWGRVEAFLDTVLLLSFASHLLRHVLFFPPSLCEPVSSLRIELSFRCSKFLVELFEFSSQGKQKFSV